MRGCVAAVDVVDCPLLDPVVDVVDPAGCDDDTVGTVSVVLEDVSMRGCVAAVDVVGCPLLDPVVDVVDPAGCDDVTAGIPLVVLEPSYIIVVLL